MYDATEYIMESLNIVIGEYSRLMSSKPPQGQSKMQPYLDTLESLLNALVVQSERNEDQTRTFGQLILGTLEACLSSDRMYEEVTSTTNFLTISKQTKKSHTYVARRIEDFLCEFYPDYGFELCQWKRRLCETIEQYKVLPDKQPQRLTFHHRLLQRLTRPVFFMFTGIYDGNNLRVKIVTNSKELVCKVRDILTWINSVLKLQERTDPLVYIPWISQDGNLHGMKFEPSEGGSYCWTNLFSHVTIVDMPSNISAEATCEEDGLEIDLMLLFEVAAVRKMIQTKRGIVVYGFDQALIPLAPAGRRRWHFVETKDKQITPQRIERELEDLGIQAETELGAEYWSGKVYVGTSVELAQKAVRRVHWDSEACDEVQAQSGVNGEDISVSATVGFQDVTDCELPMETE